MSRLEGDDDDAVERSCDGKGAASGGADARPDAMSYADTIVDMRFTRRATHAENSVP
jgi:hypothetical protein